MICIYTLLLKDRCVGGIDKIECAICSYRPSSGRAIAQAVSRRGGPSSSPGKVMWDLWWTKWHWGRFS
jgi:hypothetical protein